MENKEYLQDLKKLINGEMVAAMQYKIIADSIIGDKNLSYVQSHCDEHYQEELDHYTMLVNALMQREDNVELNLSTLVGEALPETVEMTSNNCLDAAEFFSKSEDAAINAYLEFHEKIKDVDPDLDDIITGIISDERDHKLDFDRVIGSDEELEVENSEDDIEDESDESEEESDEPNNDELRKKDKFNFDFSEDEEIKESRKMRNRLNKSKRLKEGPSAAYTLTIKDLELDKDTIKVLGKKDKDTYKFSVEVKEDLYEFSVDHSYWGGSGEEYIYGKLFGYYDIEDTDEEVEELIKEDLPDYVTISSVYGSGYSHSVLNEDFILEDKKYLISDEYFFRFEGHSENLGDSIEEIKENNLEESRKIKKRSLREKDESWYYGIPGIRFIWHNAWADAEVEYKGKYVYEPYIVDPMWDNYNEECKENGIEPNEDDFVTYMQDNDYLVKDYIESAPSSRPDDLEESRKMRSRVREKSNLSVKDFKKKILNVFEINNIDINDYYFDGEDFYVETENTNQYRLSNLDHNLLKMIEENPDLGFDSESGDDGFYSRKYVFYIYDDMDESRKIRKRSLREKSGEWYYGIPGVRLISHGTQSDAEVEYRGKYVSEYHLINTMWGFYVKDCEDEGEPVDEDYFDNHYMKDNAEDVKMVITELPSSRDDEDEEEFEDDDSEEFEEFVNRRINKVRERSEKPSKNFVERRLHNKEKYSDSINKFAKRIR